MKKTSVNSKVILLPILVFLLGTTSVWAQIDAIKDSTSIKSEFIGDARIDTLLQMHIQQNKKFPVISGYRIQIYKESGNTALDKALAIRDAFEKKYHVPAYITFNEPYYRVRVGDFHTRLEALRFLEKIKRTYPLAWEIKDDINVTP